MTTRPDPPNYTQIPNIILGNIKPGNIVDPGLMEKLKGSELKVLLAVYRLTFGFHQEERRASLQLIQDMTGMSKQSVLNAAKSLEETHGLIERKKDGGVTLWKAMVNFLDNTECQAMVQKLDPDVQKLDKVVQKLDIHLRKKPKKKTTTIVEKSTSIPDTEFGAACKCWEENIGVLSPIISDNIRNYVMECPPGWVERAINEGVVNNVRRWNYIKACLDNWIAAGQITEKPKKKGSDNGRATNLSDEQLERYRELERSRQENPPPA